MMGLPVEAIYSLGVPHNKFALPLPDRTTYPDYLRVSDARPKEFLAHFNRVRDKDWADSTILDLGCSEGSTTLALSQIGANVYGVEGRVDAVHRAIVLRDILGFGKTRFSVGNVDDEASFRQVDGMFNAGVLYHLEDPLLFLERCARYTRLFMYIDTGHAPRSEEERRNSKFSAAFGSTFEIAWRGLKIEAVNFAEPKIVAEKANGLRRKPRSGIGNTNSVWISHRSLIEVMEKLGFPYHETVSEVPIIPRWRTCFFRIQPSPPADLGPFPMPLPSVAPRSEAILNTCKRDVEYLRKQSKPVTVIGREPLLSRIVGDLRQNDICVDAALTIPGVEGGAFALKTTQDLLTGKSGFLVAAVPDVDKLSFHAVLLDQFEYVFVSFAMAAVQSQAMT